MAKVTSKGQVTIPQAIRRALAIETGDRVVFELSEAGAHLRVVRPTRLSELYASLPATRPYPGMAEIRDEVGRDLGLAAEGVD
jgi:antitoxin PrlF